MKSAAWACVFAIAPSLASAQSLEYQREVAKKKKILLEDAVRMFYALALDPKPDLTTEEAFSALCDKGIAKADWKEDLGKEASLGKVCYMICQFLSIQGGAVMRILGPSERYCYKECVRLKLVKAAGVYARVAGRDLIGICNQVERIAAP